MRTKILTVIIALAAVTNAPAQTLFTYGNQSVDANSFLKAYNKNNSAPAGNKAKAMRDYLELYINSKLKIREAYERKFDTLPGIQQEVANLRSQISDNYMNDPEMLNRLLNEAFQRSQKDLHVAHIFIAFRNNNGVFDSAAAKTKRDDVLNRLQKGEDFMQVAQQYSDDPSAKTNKGELGYITVFTLPYEFENAVYNTPVGKYSSAIRSKSGYHIFKTIADRRAIGKIKAQQILLVDAPGANEAAKKKTTALADSLYKRLMAGENFNKLANTFSNDYVTAVAGGLMPDISPGKYDPVFEKTLWSLKKDGDISKPFQTSHGWHIVKRVSVKPIVTDFNDRPNKQDLQAKIMADSRWHNSRDFIYNRVKEVAGVKIHPYNEQALWQMSDSVLDLKPMTELGRTITAHTPLFTIGDSVYTANTWVNYAHAYRYKQDGSGAKPHSQVRDEFLEFAMYNYYREHLEDFNEEFRSQMNEFKDGNIFFEIMQQEVWNKAQADTAALRNYYEANRNNYTWNKSADAVMFFCSDETTAKALYEQVKKNPANWRAIAEGYSEKAVTDSSRFEWSQLPGLGNTTPKAGSVSAPVVNKNDNTASFAYITKVFTQPMPRTFEEAKGLVINDYQALLEKQWNDELKKKYPVVINEKVLAEISK